MNPITTLIRTVLEAAGRPAGWRVALASLSSAPALEPVPVRVAAREPRVLLRALTGVFAVGALLGAASPAAAEWMRVTTASAVDGNLVDVRVLVGDDATPLYQRAGAWDRHYFQALRGRNYALEVRNTTGQRIGVLIAVDGLNVVNGERSTLSNHESMYVLDPYETTVIRGWRTSLNDIRRFVFVDEERSYAERTGQANGDMGWIRVLAFREDRPAWRWDELDRVRRERDQRGQNELQGAPVPPSAERRKGIDNAPAPTAAAPEGAADRVGAAKGGMAELRSEAKAQDAAPGTGWGEHRYDPVNQVEFHAERAAADRITLRYEYTDGLRALGIEPRRSRVWEREHGELGFAKPPKW